MENKFTPGPWHPVQYAGFWNIQTTPFYEEGVNVLDAENVGIEQAEANAKLMAAAPDLLEFAKQMASRYPNSLWITDEANKLIKKATS